MSSDNIGNHPTAGNDRNEVGKVAAPPRFEATSTKFYFWVRRCETVETGQLVCTPSQYGVQSFTTYGIVNEVYRQSRKGDMSEEYDQYDGDITYSPPFNPEGITFAEVSTLRTELPVQAPPLEGSPVVVGGPQEFLLAYNLENTSADKLLALGLIKNGGLANAGPGYIDLDFLLGTNAGHMNINGMAGQGTKSSFLLFTIYMLLRHVRQLAAAHPSARNHPIIVPVIFNVKGFDLFHIDRPNGRFNSAEHLATWQNLGIPDPGPFTQATFYAAQETGNNPISTGRTEQVIPFSWGLADVIREGLLQYLFAEGDRENFNFTALVLELEETLTGDDGHGGFALNTNPNGVHVSTFHDLLNIARDEERRDDLLHGHLRSTWLMFARRLNKILLESRGVIRRDESTGRPLDVRRIVTTDPQVIDLAGLSQTPELQRFVVAAVFRQLVLARTGHQAVQNLRYLVALDELNRFAPKAASDPITRLIENVASEMRSQGILLLGAQQQASRVSSKVIENAGIKVYGRTGAIELSTETGRTLSETTKRKVANLNGAEKLISQPTFREPLHVEVPFPAWAMNPEEARNNAPASHNGAGPVEADELDFDDELFRIN